MKQNVNRFIHLEGDYNLKEETEEKLGNDL